jgi:S-adenosylmethionine synthetase
MTSEAVAAGHPDKVADRISDEILDDCLRQNPRARVAVETLVTRGHVVIAGEVSGAKPGYEEIARRAITDIGYHSADFDFLVLLHQQSEEIAQFVGPAGDGAGDQGIMFGFATDETPAFMPAPIYFANRVMERCAALRVRGVPIGPDGKCQLTIDYDGGRPVRLHTGLVSLQHAPQLTQEELIVVARSTLAEVLPRGWIDSESRVIVNGFVRGGPEADTGLTGRKIIIDTYGGAAPHGGGAFSGKDPTKVDRSAAYAARFLAKNVVAAGLAKRCLIEVAYGIGLPDPLATRIDCFGTAAVDEARILEALLQQFPLRPAAIREALGLEQAIYARTAAFGHFGQEPDPDGGFSWERLDLVPVLREHLCMP